MRRFYIFLLFTLVICHLADAEIFSPIIEDSQGREQWKAQPSCVIVIFGATGDLATRKLLPAIYHLQKGNHLCENTVIVACGRRDLTSEAFRVQLSRMFPVEEAPWEKFANRLFYHQVIFDQPDGYEKLKDLLANIHNAFDTQENQLFYLATQSSFFPLVIQQLHEHHLINHAADSQKWSRVIIEKPFGSDLDSALQLQEQIAKHLDETQVFCADHYLGKVGVQNLLSLRFVNRTFESMWNNQHIDHVQITLSEDIGIETRGSFWEATGALRDLLQNHLMQLLSIVAMESPQELTAANIWKNKSDAINAIRPFPREELDHCIVRGQYGPGVVNGRNVLGYRQEAGVMAASNVETYVAAKIFIDNERWQGVPFYIRCGKRLAKRVAEIGITFKSQPDGSFNTLFIQIQPHVEIVLRNFNNTTKTESVQIVNCKVEDSLFGRPFPEAYEKVIYEAIQGNKSLFVQAEEQIAAWKLLTPILQFWENRSPEKFPNYDAGSWGPEAANQMLKQQGHQWELLVECVR